jgi:hypothetical protein
MQRILAGLCLLLFSGVSAADTMAQRLDALVAVDDGAIGRLSTTGRAAAVAGAYDRLFGEVMAGTLQHLALEELRHVHDATNLAHFSTLRRQDLEAMERTVAELVARKAQTPADIQDLYGAYVAMRQFSRARALADRHGLDNAEALPTIASELPDDFRGATLLRTSDAHGGLTRSPFAPASGQYILVVSHPLCQFSRNALAAIEGDAILRALFRDNATWIAPVDRRLHLGALQAFNAAHPDSAIAIAYRRDEWPQVDYWGTPSFYFFSNGTLVAQVSGWPKEGRRAELIDAARKAGLHDRAHASRR